VGAAGAPVIASSGRQGGLSGSVKRCLMFHVLWWHLSRLEHCPETDLRRPSGPEPPKVGLPQLCALGGRYCSDTPRNTRVAARWTCGCAARRWRPQLCPHRVFVARRAPSAMAANFAQQIEGWPTRVPRPQSVPASTFSRPTNLA
jgi:hypothetical protein